MKQHNDLQELRWYGQLQLVLVLGPPLALLAFSTFYPALLALAVLGTSWWLGLQRESLIINALIRRGK